MTDTPQMAADSSRDGKLALDQLALALRNLRPHPYLMPIFALAVCAIYSTSVPLTTLAGWYAGFVLCLVPLAIVLKQFFARERAVSETRRWVLLATAAYTVTTLAWVTQPIFLWSHSSDLNHLMMILFLAGYLSGQSSFVAPSRELTGALFIIEGIALVATPLRAGGFIYEVLSVVTFFYAVYTVYVSREIYYSAKHMLNLQHDKTDLIAELANAKTESDRARYRAEAASRSKSQFLANMSHELRTPLNAIIGFSEIIASGAFVKTPERHVEYSELIHKSGHHLLALINDILDLAKIEAGALVLREVDIDIGRLIADETTLLTSKAEASGVRLQAHISDAIPPVFADERAIKQIVLNLLSNAVKFTPSGGSVTAFAEVATGAALAFGVVDTGVGIAPEDQEKVFENFGQGRHDVATADKGTGLGLAIVKGLIDAHGGRVTLESKVGEGTRVTVYLPNERARPRQGSQAA